MWPDRVSNPGPPTYESGALPIVLRGPAYLIPDLAQSVDVLPDWAHRIIVLSNWDTGKSKKVK